MIQDPSIQWCFNDQYDAEIIFNTKRGFYQVDLDLEKKAEYYGINKEECKKRDFCWKFEYDEFLIPGC